MLQCTIIYFMFVIFYFSEYRVNIIINFFSFILKIISSSAILPKLVCKQYIMIDMISPGYVNLLNYKIIFWKYFKAIFTGTTINDLFYYIDRMAVFKYSYLII